MHLALVAQEAFLVHHVSGPCLTRAHPPCMGASHVRQLGRVHTCPGAAGWQTPRRTSPAVGKVDSRRWGLTADCMRTKRLAL